LGRSNGNSMLYFHHLISPFLLIVGFRFLGRQTAPTPLLLLALLDACLIFRTLPPPPRAHADVWSDWRSLVKAHQNIYAPPPLAWLLPAAERVVVQPSAHDAALLVVLALACTLFPYALALVALRYLSAFETTLAVNLEPVYAIALAIVLLNEQRDLEPGFYFGVALIMGIVFSHPWVSRRWGRRATQTTGSKDPAPRTFVS